MSLKNTIKKILKSIAPQQAEAYFNRRINEHQLQFEEKLGLPKLQSQYLKDNPATVLRGPFKGMNYISEATGSMYVPKLIGSYEEELHPFLEEMILCNPSLIVDIGCAEGYYAVGMARTLPNATIHAFDMDERARLLCAKLAQCNDVEKRVKIGIEASAESLSNILQKGSFIICDCEGCESFVLDPLACKTLSHCDILIEIHEHLVPGTMDTLKKSFSGTHEWIIIGQEPRNTDKYPELATFVSDDALKLVSEYRPLAQKWVFLRYNR